jgi:hypothetical protein
MIFLYGGIDKKTVHSDIFVLDIKAFVWRKFFQLEFPKSRVNSVFFNLVQQKFMVGGCSYPENVLFNEVWTLSLDSIAWEKDVLELSGLIWKKRKLRVIFHA